MQTPARRLVAWLAIVALVIVALVAWTTRRGPRETADERGTPGAARLADERVTEVSAPETSTGSRTRAPDVAIESGKPPVPESPATGRLRLRVVDAASGTALEGAQCVVYAERGGNKTYGRLTTDAGGRAEIGELPENTILVHVLRDPPRASAYAGVWLRVGETRELEIRVGAGGTITGRVVDDAGRPVEGADVSVTSEERPQGATAAGFDTGSRANDPPEARSSGEGRFEVHGLLSRPRGIWIVEDALRPTSFDDVVVRVRLGDVVADVRVQLGEDGHVDVGEVVLERAGVWAGRVLDAHRNPVANALVGITSPAMLRKEVLDRREGLARTGEPERFPRTQADGSFLIEARTGFAILSVATEEGIAQFFKVPVLEPGERRDDLELVLDDAFVIELEFQNAEGRPIARGRLPIGRGVPHPTGGALGDRLQVSVAWDDGREISLSQEPDRDGVFRVQTPGEPRTARSLRCELSGYLPLSTSLPPADGRSERQRFTLHEVPSVRVHLKVAEPKGAEPDIARVSLEPRVCALAPAQLVDDESPFRRPCCGLGSSLTLKLQPLEQTLEFPVRTASERFWVHAWVLTLEADATSQIHRVLLHEQHLGPFAPGLAVVEVEIPSIEVPAREPAVTSPPPTREQVPPPVQFPRNELVGAAGAEKPTPRKSNLRVLEANGDPARRGTELRVLSGSGSSLARAYVSDDEGRGSLSAELNGSCLLWVREARPAPPLEVVNCTQLVEVARIEHALASPIRLAPWRDVEVRVGGAAAELPDAWLEVFLDAQELPAGIEADWARSMLRGLAPLADGTRRFRGVVPAGRFGIAARSGLFELPSQTVEVRDTDELQVFRLSSARR